MILRRELSPCHIANRRFAAGSWDEVDDRVAARLARQSLFSRDRPARSYLTVRVVPVALGAHAAMTGAFRVMEFAEFKPVAYLESETSSLFLEKPVEIQAYRRILGALADTALDEGAEPGTGLFPTDSTVPAGR